MRWYTTGKVGPATIGKSGKDYLVAGKNPRFLGDEVGYDGAHIRVRQERGSASNYWCAHCGGDALHWAYDHKDPDELVSPAGLRYSAKLKHYIPLCVKCHSALDRSKVVT